MIKRCRENRFHYEIVGRGILDRFLKKVWGDKKGVGKMSESELRKKLNPLALSLLQSYTFPGNVRELKNLIKKAVIMSEGREIDGTLLSSIGNEVFEEWSQDIQVNKKIHNLTDVLAALEKEMLKTAMRKCRTTRDMAAFFFFIHPSVVRKLKKHNLSQT